VTFIRGVKWRFIGRSQIHPFIKKTLCRRVEWGGGIHAKTMKCSEFAVLFLLLPYISASYDIRRCFPQLWSAEMHFNDCRIWSNRCLYQKETSHQKNTFIYLGNKNLKQKTCTCNHYIQPIHISSCRFKTVYFMPKTIKFHQ
jgi:hypothetical protein